MQSSAQSGGVEIDRALHIAGASLRFLKISVMMLLMTVKTLVNPTMLKDLKALVDR